MIFAHGVGSRGDLPLPPWMFTWGAALALVISFFVLGTRWTKPRLALAAKGSVVFGSPIPLAVRVVRSFGRIAAMALFLVALWAGLFGADDADRNMLPVTLYVVVWVGAQLLSGVVGNVWRAINPLVILAEGVDRLRVSLGVKVVPAPDQLGQWPAALGLFAFLLLELAHPNGASPRVLGWTLFIHTAISLGLAFRFGSAWLADHEPFSALFAFVGRMAPLGQRNQEAQDQGLEPVIVSRLPMSGLSTVAVVPGTLAALLIVLGGTSYDGFSESELGREIIGRPSGWGGAMTELLGLSLSIGVIAALFWGGAWWVSRVTNLGLGNAAKAFTPSLVPIVFGYAIAHYAQLLVDETQTFVFTLSDPGDLGWNLFGGADATIDFNLISPNFLAWIQVIGILLGHIGAVVVAHDRALELFSVRDSYRSQFAMLFVMVAYSTLGLWLLLNA